MVAPDAAGADYSDELVQRLRRSHLADSPQWRALVHYLPDRLGGGWTSLVVSPDFFLARTGKSDPEAEAEASLRAFLTPARRTRPDSHPRCRFPARFRWLVTTLQVDTRRVPEQQCPGYSTWQRKLDPGRASLVFASAYLDNPASLFGHTLLRIDPAHPAVADPMLSYAASFAAATGGDTLGVRYALKGLFGGYRGVFNWAPYYEIVREYGDFQHRDLWEYELSFTGPEVERLLQHAWELRAASFDYYFLDQNCAYQLLALLDVARPGLRLSDHPGAWTIPADTLREIVQRAGLVVRVTYREAPSRVLQRRYRALDAPLRDLALGLASGEVEPSAAALAALGPSDRAKVLDVAADDVIDRKSKPRRTDQDLDGRLHRILLARNGLGAAPFESGSPNVQTRPDQGHGSVRLGLGYALENGQNFLRLDWRPAYHDLLDPQGGYPVGAQLQFFNTVLRVRPDVPEVQLDRLDVVDIVSLSPWATPLYPVSWRIGAGAERVRLPGRIDPLTGFVRAGAGLATEPGPGTLAFAFLDTMARFADALPSFAALRLGGSAGIYHDISDRWRVALSAEAGHDFLTDASTSYALRVSQRITLDRDSSLRLDLSNARQYGASGYAVSLQWYWYR